VLSKDGALNELPVAGMRASPACGFWEIGCAGNIHSNACRAEGDVADGYFSLASTHPGRRLGLILGLMMKGKPTRYSSKSGAKGFQARFPLQVPGRAVGV